MDCFVFFVSGQLSRKQSRTTLSKPKDQEESSNDERKRHNERKSRRIDMAQLVPTSDKCNRNSVASRFQISIALQCVWVLFLVVN